MRSDLDLISTIKSDTSSTKSRLLVFNFSARTKDTSGARRLRLSTSASLSSVSSLGRIKPALEPVTRPSLRGRTQLPR
ncbi:hypothetical protein NOS3756_47880 [Nostoc sp. NIES-3756]|nr:hypothetical protein NOS3756_47880 [Nostoc sp. NIES-3756]